MKRIRFLPGVLILAAGILIGLVVAGQLDWQPQSNAEIAASAAPVKTPETALPAQADPIPNQDIARQLNDTFIAIAKQVNPSVVTIFSERVLKSQQVSPYASPFFENPFRDFFGDDFFNRFFSPSPPDRRGEAPRVQGMGSGVIVSSDGYIITNNHVVSEADELEVMLLRGKRVKAEIVGTDPKTDIAVIKVKENGLRPIKIGDSDKLRVGEWVIAVGSPLSAELNHTVTSGIVSAKGRSQVGLADYEDFIQTDAAINPGNSGGALVNLNGELVGINTAIATRTGGFQGIGFAVPINMAKAVMDELIEHGKVVRGWLGVLIQDVDENLKESLDLPSTKGALVNDVAKDGPAEKAGLQQQDFIMAIDGMPVENTNQLRNKVASIAPGTEVDLTVWRDGREKHIRVELGELPTDEPSGEPGRGGGYENLGFAVRDLTPELANRFDIDPAEEGVVITNISRNSNAFDAGLRQGDLIRAIDKQRVTSVRDFRRIVGKKERGDNILIHAKRRGRSFFVAFPIE